jgi:2-polyprenyl-6-methoxyphenol hydroxylase-like FAD-dependent oxidoreductase
VTRPTGHYQIAGAGPAGLTLAAALVRAGTESSAITVYDSLTESTAANTGAHLGLSPAAVSVLADHDSFAALAAQLRAAPRIDSLHIVRSADSRAVVPLDPPWMMLTRNQLANALLVGVRALGVTVHFDTPIQSVSRLSTDWTVGADGAHSVVRRAPGFAGLPTPVNTGTVAHFTHEYSGPAPVLTPHALTFFQGAHRSAVGFLADDNGKTVVAFIRAPRQTPLHELELPVGDDVLGALSRTFQEPIQIWQTDLPPQSDVSSDGSPWLTERMLLIGDAAHVKSPAFGSGAADAISDAIQLAPALSVGGRQEVAAALNRNLEREYRQRNRTSLPPI